MEIFSTKKKCSTEISAGDKDIFLEAAKIIHNDFVCLFLSLHEKRSPYLE